MLILIYRFVGKKYVYQVQNPTYNMLIKIIDMKCVNEVRAKFALQQSNASLSRLVAILISDTTLILSSAKKVKHQTCNT